MNSNNSNLSKQFRNIFIRSMNKFGIMKCFVTGGAGFIGSNLVEDLIEDHEVVVYDNLVLGRKEFLSGYSKNKDFSFIEADLLDMKTLRKSIKGCGVVFHLAANSDISNNKITDIDLKNGTIATYNLLEAMRLDGIKKIIFSSTSAIYGEAIIKPTPEVYGPLLPISFYGASKLACESLISAFCHNFGMQSWIFRFANIAGKNGTHGAVVDFIIKLRKDSKNLLILGNGKQSKPYLHVKDCVEGMLHGWKNSNEEVNYFNLACEGSTSVDKIAKIVVEAMNLKNVKFNYTGTERGWPGDVPQVLLSAGKMKSIGWQAKLTSDGAVRKAAKELVSQLIYL